jgi:hypothetical protein
MVFFGEHLSGPPALKLKLPSAYSNRKSTVLLTPPVSPAMTGAMVQDGSEFDLMSAAASIGYQYAEAEPAPITPCSSLDSLDEEPETPLATPTSLVFEEAEELASPECAAADMVRDGSEYDFIAW